MEITELVSGHGEFYIQNLAIIICALGIIYLIIKFKLNL